MYTSQKPDDSQPTLAWPTSRSAPHPAHKLWTNSIVHCIHSLLFTHTQHRGSHPLRDKHRECTFAANSKASFANVRMLQEEKKALLAQLVYDSDISIHVYAFLRRNLATERLRGQEEQQYHFLCLSACKTASSNTCVTPALIFTKPSGSLADNTQMTFPHVLKGRASATQSSTLPHILQEHFQRRASALLKCADKEGALLP